MTKKELFEALKDVDDDARIDLIIASECEHCGGSTEFDHPMDEIGEQDRTDAGVSFVNLVSAG